jgi:diphthine-ammonia ligase
LWGRDRKEMLDRLVSLGFDVIFSAVKKPWLSEDWLGKRLDSHSIKELKIIWARTGLDICGENGEYHTLVLGAPYFKKHLEIHRFSKATKDNLAYLDLTQ